MMHPRRVSERPLPAHPYPSRGKQLAGLYSTTVSMMHPELWQLRDAATMDYGVGEEIKELTNDEVGMPRFAL